MNNMITVINIKDNVQGTTQFDTAEQAQKFFFDGIRYDLKNGRDVKITSEPFQFISVSSDKMIGAITKRIYQY